MWLENIVGIATFCFVFMYLRQITTWTTHSFRFGLVIRKYKKPFPGKIPKEFINKEIVCNNIHFKFSSPNKGLFRAYTKFRGVVPSMLGEVNINRSGFAEISIRFSLAFISMGISLFLVLFWSNLEGGFTLNNIIGSVEKSLFPTIVSSILVFIFAMFEKADLDDGIKELDKRIKNDTL